MQLFINNWSSALTLPATASATQLSVPEADADLLVGLGGGDHYLLTLALVDAQGVEIAWEVVRITGKAGGELDVLREQEGTTALDWEAGVSLIARATAETFDTLRDSGGPDLSDAAPLALGSATAGTSSDSSRADHVHPLPTPGDIGAATTSQGDLADTAVQPAALTSALAGKVDVDGTKVLSDENYTSDEKAKLAGLESSRFKGLYASLAALEAAHPTAGAGDYADVDAGVGSDTLRYVWDVDDAQWIGSGSGTPLTAAQIKTLYESNADTNAFTDSEKSKLDGVAAGATANANTDSLAEGSTNLYHTAARVRAVVLTGLSLAVGTAVAATDTVLEAFGKLQKQINDLVASLAGKQATLVSGTNIKTLNGSTLLGSGDLAISGVSLSTVETFTGNKTLALTDINTYNVSEDAAAQAVTVPAQATVAWTDDAEMHFEQGAAGAVTINGAIGVTINGVSAGSFVLAGKGAVASLKRKSENSWTLVGGLLSAISAKAYNSENIPIADSVFTDLTFDTTNTESGGDIHDPAFNSGRLTAPISGQYVVGASALFLTNAVGRRIIRIQKNGSVIIVRDDKQTVTSGSGNTGVGVATLVNLAAGDYITAQVFQDSGTTLSVLGTAQYSPQIWMARVGP